MITPDIIIRYFKLNHQVLHMQTKGLSHEDSLLTPPFRSKPRPLLHLPFYRYLFALPDI